MIGSLRGTLLERGVDGEAMIEVAGVGYRLQVTPATSVGLGDIGAEVFVHVHHHIREGDQSLYGFATRDQRVAFEILISAHGVGPKLALDILTVHAPTDLRTVLASDDVEALCLVPGVGKKTAQRLLVELKSKLDLPEVDLRELDGDDNVAAGPSALADVRDALTGLGYQPDEIRGAVADLPADGDSAELIKQALAALAGAN